ncbi:hypothetical protein [Paucimonas lemoignei]|uniref:hypothetical protein n=1 Tax=Paucimonas lemoignei TaxID=29443 RepID=UPI001052E99B|nr:hypothetical protein [Paucimonas lemoignei]
MQQGATLVCYLGATWLVFYELVLYFSGAFLAYPQCLAFWPFLSLLMLPKHCSIKDGAMQPKIAISKMKFLVKLACPARGRGSPNRSGGTVLRERIELF